MERLKAKKEIKKYENNFYKKPVLIILKNQIE